jgi:hypothetical protein
MFKIQNIFLLFIIIQMTQSKKELEYETCGSIKCAKNYGTCELVNTEYVCNCDSKYTTYPEESEIKCNYERKRQLKAFLLEFFLTYGAGHFYTHNYKYAIPKLCVFVFLYCLFIGLRIISKAKEENKTANLIICISAAICFVGMISWQIYDVVKYAQNKYKDGNGIELRGW